MPAYKCTVCKNDKGKDRPCHTRSVGEGMEHLDLCILTGEFGVAKFEKVEKYGRA